MTPAKTRLHKPMLADGHGYPVSMVIMLLPHQLGGNAGCSCLFEKSSGVGAHKTGLPPTKGWQVRAKRLTACTFTLFLNIFQIGQDIFTPVQTQQISVSGIEHHI